MQIQNLETSVKVIGEGQPVLLLHGWGGNIASMEPVAQRLAPDGFACHVLDLPGFGGTQLPPTAWTVPDYARWVIAYMDAVGLEKVHLLGHSFGGRISIVLGADYASRVHKIVLTNAAGVKLPPPLNIRAYYMVRKVLFALLSLPGLGGQKERLRAYFRQKYGSADYLNAGPLLETFRLVIGQDLREYAKRIQAPTLLFWGDQDLDTPLQGGRILEKIIPDAALILFEGAGHFAYLDRLADFVRITSHFYKN
jgi:pimeloyl-ACP methyl ester carboxylesterase